ncbi:MAG TPA: tyrosine-type recombinase/integrase [Terriglobales bacterium]|nr:tyrosine-type recombinase/integrase [Terriglobales bacterium]
MARKTGQLISRGSRTWLVRVSLGRDSETGTRKYHNKTVRGSFREAQTYLNGKLQEREIGRLPRAAAISLNQYLDQWLTTAAKPRLRPKSYIDYAALLRLHIRPILGTRPLGAIVQFDIQSIYSQMFERGLSARTIEYTNAVLQSALRQAVRWKMLGEDPCIGVDLPRMKRREMEALSVEEYRRFLAVARETEWFALYALALTTGMRPSEYLALKWSDIDWHRGAASVCRTIQHSKAGFLFDDTKRKRSRRVVKLQDFVRKALDCLRNSQLLPTEGECQVEHDLIFRSGTGSPLKQRPVKREFRRLLETAGIRPIRLYDLRHTAATLAVAAGVSVKVISDQLGHASISFTLERYSHVLPSIQDEAAVRVERMLMGPFPDALMPAID